MTLGELIDLGLFFLLKGAEQIIVIAFTYQSPDAPFWVQVCGHFGKYYLEEYLLPNLIDLITNEKRQEPFVKDMMRTTIVTRAGLELYFQVIRPVFMPEGVLGTIHKPLAGLLYVQQSINNFNASVTEPLLVAPFYIGVFGGMYATIIWMLWEMYHVFNLWGYWPEGGLGLGKFLSFNMRVDSRGAHYLLSHNVLFQFELFPGTSITEVYLRLFRCKYYEFYNFITQCYVLFHYPSYDQFKINDPNCFIPFKDFLEYWDRVYLKKFFYWPVFDHETAGRVGAGWRGDNMSFKNLPEPSIYVDPLTNLIIMDNEPFSITRYCIFVRREFSDFASTTEYDFRPFWYCHPPMEKQGYSIDYINCKCGRAHEHVLNVTIEHFTESHRKYYAALKKDEI